MEQPGVAELYRRMGPVIYSRCLRLLGNREDALDALHDVFVILQRKLASFRGEADIMTWIYRVATNHCLNRLEARAVRRRVLTPAAYDDETTAGEPTTAPLEQRQLLQQLLARFRPRLVQMAVHHFVDGMTQEEIAEVMGVSDRAVRKALKKFRDDAGRHLTQLQARPRAP